MQAAKFQGEVQGVLCKKLAGGTGGKEVYSRRLTVKSGREERGREEER
jgi:hypothetical protein